MNSIKNFQRHPFHLVDPSPWPIFSATMTFTMVSGGVMWFHGYSLGGWTLAFGGIGVLWNMYTWWRDITREATLRDGTLIWYKPVCVMV